MNDWHMPWKAGPLAPDTNFPRVMALGPIGSCLASWCKLGTLIMLCILDVGLLV